MNQTTNLAAQTWWDLALRRGAFPCIRIGCVDERFPSSRGSGLCLTMQAARITSPSPVNECKNSPNLSIKCAKFCLSVPVGSILTVVEQMARVLERQSQGSGLTSGLGAPWTRFVRQFGSLSDQTNFTNPMWEAHTAQWIYTFVLFSSKNNGNTSSSTIRWC